MRLAIAIGALACAASGAANADEQTFDLSGFDEISIAEGLTAVITVGGDYSVRAEGDDDALERFDIEVEGDELKMGRKSKWTGVRRNQPIHVTVSLPALTALDVSTGSKATATGVSADKFDLDVSTGASVTISGECDLLRLDASTGASVDARELKCREANADAAFGGTATIFASEEVNAGASFGGDIDVYGSPAQVSRDTSFGGDVSTMN